MMVVIGGGKTLQMSIIYLLLSYYSTNLVNSIKVTIWNTVLTVIIVPIDNSLTDSKQAKTVIFTPKNYCKRLNQMEIININKVNLNEEGKLIPPDVAENIGRLWFRGLVAQDSSTDKSAGGIVWEYKNAEDDETDTEAEIIWAAGESKEVLNVLLEAYRDEVQAESAVRSTFELPLAQNTTLIEEVFSGDGFEIATAESRDIYVTVKDLMGLKLGKGKPAFYIKALKELSTRQFKNGITDVIFQGRKGLLEDIAWVSADRFEPDISSCVVMDDIVKGFFLIHKTATGILVAELLFSVEVEKGKTILELIRFTLGETIKKYPPETKILLRRHNGLVHSLVKKLFPAKKGEEVISGNRPEETGGI